ncbi:MAG: signal transduction histidine kinase [Myxococcota bacterium]|jgi:signal transduction histidine kinase
MTAIEERLAGRLKRVRKPFGFLRSHRHAPLDAAFQEKLAARYRDSLDGARETCDVVVTGAQNSWIAADPATIDSIVDALLSNAKQHGTAPIKVHVETAENTVRLVVSDAGPGIPFELVDEVFEPFMTTRGHDGGTGLGLPIVRALAEAHGRRLELDQSEGPAAHAVPARFRLVLPRATSHRD